MDVRAVRSPGTASKEAGEPAQAEQSDPTEVVILVAVRLLVSQVVRVGAGVRAGGRSLASCVAGLCIWGSDDRDSERFGDIVSSPFARAGLRSRSLGEFLG